MTVNSNKIDNMKETQTPQGVRTNGAGHEATNSPDNQTANNLDLVYRIKGAIDQRGKYSFRVDDMAAGYAAVNGITQTEARKSIEERFKTHVGESPKEYLERQYALKKQNGMVKGKGQRHSR